VITTTLEGSPSTSRPLLSHTDLYDRSRPVSGRCEEGETKTLSWFPSYNSGGFLTEVQTRLFSSIFVLVILIVTLTIAQLGRPAGNPGSATSSAEGFRPYIDQVRVFHSQRQGYVRVWARIRPERGVVASAVAFVLWPPSHAVGQEDSESLIEEVRKEISADSSDYPLGVALLWSGGANRREVDVTNIFDDYKAGGNWLWGRLEPGGWPRKVTGINAVSWGPGANYTFRRVKPISTDCQRWINIALAFLLLIVILSSVVASDIRMQTKTGATTNTGHRFRDGLVAERSPASTLTSAVLGLILWPLIVGGGIFVLFAVAPNSSLIPILLSGNPDFTDFGWGYVIPLLFEGGWPLSISLGLVCLEVLSGILTRLGRVAVNVIKEKRYS